MRDHYCPVHQVWGELREHIVEKMKSKSFQDLAREEEENLKEVKQKS